MTVTPPAEGGAEEPARTVRRWPRVAGGLLGLGLLVAAIVVVARRGGDDLEAALAALRQPAPGLMAALLVAVVVNQGLTGLFFHRLYARHGRIGLGEMQAVMAAATLLNHLPLRPGLAARVAYHRRAHGIGVGTSIGVMVRAMGVSVAVAGVVAVLLIAGGGRPGVVAIGVGGLGAGLAVLVPMAPRIAPWPAAALIRCGEIGCTVLRTWAAFALVGAPVDAGTAIAIACVAVVVTLVPFTSNGLGLREWATGLLAPVLAGVPLEVAVAAELVARAGEILVALVAGGAGLAWLRGRPGPGGATSGDPGGGDVSPGR